MKNDIEISKVSKYISDLLKLDNPPQIIEVLENLPNEFIDNKKLEIVGNFKWYHYQGKNIKKNELSDNLFRLIDKITLKDLSKLWNSKNCIKIQQQKSKNNNFSNLCSFLAGLISAKVIKNKESIKNTSIYDPNPVIISTNIDDVIQSINTNCKIISEEIQLPQDAIYLEELSREEIIKRIDNILEMKEDPKISYTIPSLTPDNIIFDEKGRYFLGKKRQTLTNEAPNYQINKIMEISEIIRNLLLNNEFTYLDNIYRNIKQNFKNSYSINKAIRQLALLIGTHYDNLHVFSNIGDNIKGNLVFRDKLAEWDLTKIKRINIPIDRYMEVVDSDALAIIAIENEGEMIKLSMTDFYKKFPCIIISSTYLNHYTRNLIKRISSKFEIPVFGIFELRTRGINNILSLVYSDNETASETQKLALNNFYLLGLMLEDIIDYNLNEDNMMEMSVDERESLKSMLKLEPILRNKNLSMIIKKMLKLNKITTLFGIMKYSNHYNNFPNYILSKINNGDFIKL